MQTKNCEDGVFKRGKFSSSIAHVLARWRGERDDNMQVASMIMCRGSIIILCIYITSKAADIASEDGLFKRGKFRARLRAS